MSPPRSDLHAGHAPRNQVGGGAGIGVLFFLTVVVLMPFREIGPDMALLSRIDPAILWLGALLASLLTPGPPVHADHEDGSLDLILMGDTPLELSRSPRQGVRAPGLTTALPLVVVVPLLGLFTNLDRPGQ